MQTHSTHSLPPFHLQIFSQMSKMIAPSTNLNDLAKAATAIIQSVLSVENCSIMLLDADGLALNMLFSSVIPATHWNRIRVPLGYGVAGEVAETGQPHLMTQIRKENETESHSTKGKYYTDSFISVPLRLSEGANILGVINATDRTSRQPMTQMDLQILTAIAELISVTIESHRTWLHANEARRHLSQVVDGVPIGMFTISSNGRIEFCNRAARHHLNISETAPLTDVWQECFPEAVKPYLQKALDSLRRGRSSVSLEFDLPNTIDTGPDRSVRLSAIEAEEISTLEENHALFLVEDLQQKQELAELRQSDRMKANFLSLISHELRTPLAAIKGAIHLLNQMAPAEMRKTAHGIFSILHRNNDRLTRVVNNILDVMDLESGALQLYRKRSDLHALITRITDRAQVEQINKHINWVIKLEATQPEIYADENRVGQVVEHLLDNSLKFTPIDGEIAILTSSNNGMWRLEVNNAGPAIPSHLAEKIFSKFFQIDDTLTRETGGSGVGLFLCREIIRLHGGEVTLNTDYDKGTSFVVSLPEIISSI